MWGDNMIQITTEQIDAVREFVPEIDDFLKKNDLSEILMALNFAIVEFGMDENQEHLTEKGVKMQKMYDDIYWQNK